MNWRDLAVGDVVWNNTDGPSNLYMYVGEGLVARRRARQYLILGGARHPSTVYLNIGPAPSWSRTTTNSDWDDDLTVVQTLVKAGG